MNKPNALEFDHGKNRYNCAQAVLKAYAPLAGAAEASVEQFAGYGGGRAPDGQCGALYAAKALLPDPDARQEVEQEFLASAGTTACRDIRSGQRVSCQQCVQLAADALFSQVCKNVALEWPLERSG